MREFKKKKELKKKMQEKQNSQGGKDTGDASSGGTTGKDVKSLSGTVGHTIPSGSKKMDNEITGPSGPMKNSKEDTLKTKKAMKTIKLEDQDTICLLYTSPSPRDLSTSRMPSSA
eukprot:TRINITY_DN26938_c0_g1_i1.p2 TRINITY_DN26938_c0_g1~~TRINITY_DN26938_c0_g1_i1.p2  ORF type:complete len:115 (-),score=27.51 TRINITY_DN26938_c0_g1_i1:88-432(-)